MAELDTYEGRRCKNLLYILYAPPLLLLNGVSKQSRIMSWVEKALFQHATSEAEVRARDEQRVSFRRANLIQD